MKIRVENVKRFGMKLGHCKGLQLKVFANCGRDRKPVQETGILKTIQA
jgi:hypothetical protein